MSAARSVRTRGLLPLGVTTLGTGVLSAAAVVVDRAMARSGNGVPRAVVHGLEIAALALGAVTVGLWLLGLRRSGWHLSAGAVLAIAALIGVPIAVEGLTPRDVPSTLWALDAHNGALKWTVRAPVAWVSGLSSRDGLLTLDGLSTKVRCTTEQKRLTYRSDGTRVQASIVPTAQVGAPALLSRAVMTARLPDVGLRIVETTHPPDASDRVEADSLASGRRQWSVSTGPYRRAYPVTNRHGDVLVLLPVDSAGSTIDQPVSGLPGAYAAGVSKPYPDTSPTAVVTVLDARTGHALWTEPGDWKIERVLATDDAIYELDAQTLVVRDTHSGRTILRRALPPVTSPLSGLQLVRVDRDSVVALDPVGGTVTLYSGHAGIAWSTRLPGHRELSTATRSPQLVFIAASGRRGYACGGD